MSFELRHGWIIFPAVDNNPNLLGFTVAIYDIGRMLIALWCFVPW